MPNPKGNEATLKKYTPKWKSGQTQTIRVPIVLASKILDYAHKLDENPLTQVDENGSSKAVTITSQDQEAKLRKALTQVIESLELLCETPNTSKFTKTLKARIQTEAIERLKALIQVDE